MDLSTLLKEVWTDFGAIITGVAGFLGGMLTSRYTFHLEQKREQMKRRREIIDMARRELISEPASDITKADLIAKGAYKAIAPYFSPAFREEMETNLRICVLPHDNMQRALAAEIVRLEREWKVL